MPLGEGGGGTGKGDGRGGGPPGLPEAQRRKDGDAPGRRERSDEPLPVQGQRPLVGLR